METEMKAAIQDYQKLLSDDLPAFNRSLTARNLAAVIAATSM
jgi:hypothetical protein